MRCSSPSGRIAPLLDAVGQILGHVLLQPAQQQRPKRAESRLRAMRRLDSVCPLRAAVPRARRRRPPGRAAHRLPGIVPCCRGNPAGVMMLQHQHGSRVSVTGSTPVCVRTSFALLMGRPGPGSDGIAPRPERWRGRRILQFLQVPVQCCSWSRSNRAGVPSFAQVVVGRAAFEHQHR